MGSRQWAVFSGQFGRGAVGSISRQFSVINIFYLQVSYSKSFYPKVKFLEKIMDFRDLMAFQKAYSLAMEIFEVSKLFPKEEKYSLIDQIRRSSRSVCINITEGYRKRMYPLHFVSKMSDADMENSETVVWLEFAFSCKYLEEKNYKQLVLKNQEIGKLLNFMIQNPEKFGVKIGVAKP